MPLGEGFMASEVIQQVGFGDKAKLYHFLGVEVPEADEQDFTLLLKGIETPCIFSIHTPHVFKHPHGFHGIGPSIETAQRHHHNVQVMDSKAVVQDAAAQSETVAGFVEVNLKVTDQLQGILKEPHYV